MINQELQHSLNEEIKSTLKKLENDINRNRMQHQYNTRRTNNWVKLCVVALIIMGVFNILYVWDFYIRMQEIVNDISTLGSDVTVVSKHMVSLTDTMQSFDNHISYMPEISQSATSMSEQIPMMNESVEQMLSNLHTVNGDMTAMSHDAAQMNQRFTNVTRGVNQMGHNVNAFSGPMGMFNSFLP